MSNIINNQNVIAYLDTTTSMVYPFTGTSGFVNVYVQDSLPQTYDVVYVQPADLAASAYVTGSSGQIKTMKQYNTGATSGARAKLTTYLYLDVNLPTKYTKITETITTV